MPEMPKGTPAVVTTRSPFRRSPRFLAASKAAAKSSSVLVFSSTKMGITPQERFNCRTVNISGEQAMMGQEGRYLEIILAVFPDLVTVTMYLAPRSMEVVTVAWEMASVTSAPSSLRRWRKRAS